MLGIHDFRETPLESRATISPSKMALCALGPARASVSVRFLPSQDAIGGASFSGRVDLVGEDVFGERFANRQIETCEQLGEGFTFSAFQHS